MRDGVRLLTTIFTRALVRLNYPTSCGLTVLGRQLISVLLSSVSGTLSVTGKAEEQRSCLLRTTNKQLVS
jgi:hypothetical protein